MHPSVIEADCTDHSRAGAATWAERNKWADPEDVGKVPMSDLTLTLTLTLTPTLTLTLTVTLTLTLTWARCP